MEKRVDINKLDELMHILKNSKNICFFGGAGISTASGIPDFRGANGLYNYTPEEIISHSFFMRHTKEFYDFYFDKMIYEDALPNECHKFLKLLEDDGRLKAIVTQNIDSLHQKAGSKKVYELHGSVERNYCMRCHKFYSLSSYEMKHLKNGVPTCECGGIIKPDVVLYEEGLDNDTINESINAIASADTLIVAGTSLVVYPAASFIRFFRGNNLILINLGIPKNLLNVSLEIDGRVEDYLNTENYNKYLK